jgi:hypothetical protein
MEKRIGIWSYWLGIACLVITFGWKAGNALELWRSLPPSPADISYWSFYNGSIVFFLMSIASSCQAKSNSRKP